jgi:hypothetical protein
VAYAPSLKDVTMTAPDAQNEHYACGLTTRLPCAPRLLATPSRVGSGKHRDS